jgi:Flp pilus assembly protein TadG
LRLKIVAANNETAMPLGYFTRYRRPPRRSCVLRRGTATVELALCLPLLLIFTLGMTEVCNLMHVRQRAITAAYDGARLATRPTTSSAQTATAAEVIARCQATLTQLNVRGATATLSPASLVNIAPETPITVTIQTPMAQNSISAFVLSSNRTLTVSATLIYE